MTVSCRKGTKACSQSPPKMFRSVSKDPMELPLALGDHDSAKYAPSAIAVTSVTASLEVMKRHEEMPKEGREGGRDVLESIEPAEVLRWRLPNHRH